MITVGSILPAAGEVLANCDRDYVLGKLNEAQELLANEGHWDPLVGFMDICTQCCTITLPDEVEVPLAVNVGGHPASFQNKWFEYHLNGPGSCFNCCDFHWQDQGEVVTFRDPVKASNLGAFAERDEGMSVSFRVYGYDENEKWIMEQNLSTGLLEDGALVPILYGIGAGQPSVARFKKITRIDKPVSRGFVRLVAFDGGSKNGTLIGYYRPDETEPSYRRITVNGTGCETLSQCSPSTWVRMRFRKKTRKLVNDSDAIPLHSFTAIKLCLMAILKYEKDLLDDYKTYMMSARDALNKEQKTRSGPDTGRVQFDPGVIGSRVGENMI